MIDSFLVLIAAAFLLAGFVKGTLGLGLPTVAMGLLAVTMPPAQAIAIVIVPAIVTNIWQTFVGGYLRDILRRLWPLMVGTVIGIWLNGGMLTGPYAPYGTVVLGVLLFHVQDEPDLGAWQSGEFYVDGAAKASLFPVRSAAYAVRRGVAAACPGLQLTPKVVITVGKADKKGLRIFFTCSLDCNYTVTLDSRTLTGTGIGRVTKTLIFRGRLAGGTHQVSAQGVAPVNAGPAGTASASFRSR